MNIIHFKNSRYFKEIRPADKETRKNIGYSSYEDIVLTGRNHFYPNVLIQTGENELITPYDEKIMSLNRSSFYDNNVYTPETPYVVRERIDTPLFFMIYNFDNYYHFLYDSLPYLWTFLHLKKNIEPHLKILIQFPNPRMTSLYPFVSELLEKIVDRNDMIIHSDHHLYSSLYVSSSLTHGGFSDDPPRKEIFDIYQTIKSRVCDDHISFMYKDITKIYISRRSWVHQDDDNIGTNYTTRRKMLNEDQLVARLEKEGFVEIFTERLTTDEKIYLFMRASVICGSIGGGMANLLFSPPTTRSIVIVSPFFLEINKRFIYSMNHTNISLFRDTSLVHTDHIPLYCRVKIIDKGSLYEGKIGEITEYRDPLYIVALSDNDVVGFNQKQAFVHRSFNNTEFELLDKGLNSPYQMNIDYLFQNFIYSRMKICILLCGIGRSIDMVIQNMMEIFCGHDVEIITCLAIQDMTVKHPHIIKKIHVQNVDDGSYRNSLNYSYKIQQGVKLIEPRYDLYIIMRADLILTEPIHLDEIKDNILYFSKNHIHRSPLIDEEKKVNESIMITRYFSHIQQFEMLYDFTMMNHNYLDSVLYFFVASRDIEIGFLDISCKFILSTCNVIAISGASGAGKSTLSKIVPFLFDKDSLLILETDRYHKWERDHVNYQSYTHLNPNANYLERMLDDIYNLKIGENIYQVDYDHQTGQFTQKEKIYSKENLLICGLHTLYGHKMNQLTDLRIYIDVDEDILVQWKIRRDVEERGYPLEKVLQKIEERREDYKRYILPQRDHANVIIHYYYDSSHDSLGCSFRVVRSIGFKILGHVSLKFYHIDIDDTYITIRLKDEINDLPECVKDIFDRHPDAFQKDFFKEIFYILYMLLEKHL